MVVGNFCIVHRVAVKRIGQRLAYLAQQGGDFLEDILADVSAASAGIVYRIKTMKEERTNKNEIC
ncbi:hypothetical protein HMPREF1173_00713 [Prevotella nigrescens CC14M]|uniref:Uncharacterized protein n=1 Tax=Prevotella nigrescens CC14M TaxID=1073366 RepID=V8CRB8_9BACT|nr:hypothetical protein HMPREF1173_00713 [Prevotella nigrescens CC14M]